MSSTRSVPINPSESNQKNLESPHSSAFKNSRNASTNKKPTLWRVYTYSFPIFPRPTINFITLASYIFFSENTVEICFFFEDMLAYTKFLLTHYDFCFYAHTSTMSFSFYHMFFLSIHSIFTCNIQRHVNHRDIFFE